MLAPVNKHESHTMLRNQKDRKPNGFMGVGMKVVRETSESPDKWVKENTHASLIHLYGWQKEKNNVF